MTPATPGLIPVRFHVYWAGADKDGAVAGYYWAVTETLAVPPGDNLPIPPLPGPKARDYHFTTKTDSIFTFNASIDVPDRAHTFYVFAVDDKGKADPTPARFNFRAYDRFPPLGVIDEASATGTIYIRSGTGVVPQTVTKAITDTFEITRSFPRDTVPSGALLTFRWHGEQRAPGMTISGYQYKLDEPTFNSVDSSVHVATYNTGVGLDVISPGTKTFTLRTIGSSQWRSQTTRFFQINFAPDEWFAGPNLGDPQWQTYTDGGGHRYWYQDIAAWTALPNSQGLPGTMLSPDSVNILPSNRLEHRTFFEIYGDRIYAHQEGDTVSLNSWVVVPSGGSDPDSRYNVHVGVDPTKPIGPVTTPGVPNGSPVGFRFAAAVRRPNNQVLVPSESGVYPVFDVASVFHSPRVQAYAAMSNTGRCYFYTSAEDGDGTVDTRIYQAAGSAAALVDALEHGDNDPYKLAIQSKVLTFYVNHSPYLKTGDGQFRPPVAGATYQRGVPSTLNMLADDIDPIDFTRSIDRIGGPQPGAPAVLTRYVSVHGLTNDGIDTTVVVINGEEITNPSLTIPVMFAPGTAHLIIQVCDYRAADALVGNTGRCSAPIDVPITITGPQPAVPSTGASQSTSRPGSTAADGRRQQP